MSDEDFVIPLPVEELGIGGDPDSATAIVGLKAGGKSVAATLTPDQLGDFITRALIWSGQAHLPVRPQTTHIAPLKSHPIRAEQFGLATGSNEKYVVLEFPAGQITVAFEVRVRALATLLGKHLSGDALPNDLPKPNRNYRRACRYLSNQLTGGNHEKNNCDSIRAGAYRLRWKRQYRLE